MHVEGIFHIWQWETLHWSQMDVVKVFHITGNWAVCSTNCSVWQTKTKRSKLHITDLFYEESTGCRWISFIWGQKWGKGFLQVMMTWWCWYACPELFPMLCCCFPPYFSKLDQIYYKSICETHHDKCYLFSFISFSTTANLALYLENVIWPLTWMPWRDSFYSMRWCLVENNPPGTLWLSIVQFYWLKTKETRTLLLLLPERTKGWFLSSLWYLV